MGKSEAEIKDIKAMITAAKQKPINMGICLGKKPETIEIRLDRVRNPAALMREAKAAGETPKTACGVLTVEGVKAKLTCEEDPPLVLAKTLKKFFKSIDLPMKITIVGPDGKNYEDDDEDEKGNAAVGSAPGAVAPGASPSAQDEPEIAEPATDDKARTDWTNAWGVAEPKVAAAIAKGDAAAAKITAVRDFVLGKANSAQFEAALKALPSLLGLLAPQVAAEPAALIDPKDLIRRLGLIKPQLANAPGALGEKLTEMYQSSVDFLKTGVLAQAMAAIGQIETALAKVMSATTPDVTADPKFAKLTGAEATLRAQVASQTAGDAQDALIGVLDTVLDAIAHGEAETALSGLKRVSDGLKLQAEVDRLAPLVANAASAGKVADVNAMMNLFNFVADSVPAGDHAKAMANLARVEEMITAGAAAPSTHEADVAPEVKPLATARLNWIATRRTLHDELSKLETAIAKALDAAELGGVVEVAGTLVKYIDQLDARLEAKLDAIVNAAVGERDRLKADARGLITEYLAVLQGDFFKDVDNGNGFVSVSVTSTAQSMLRGISGVLA